MILCLSGVLDKSRNMCYCTLEAVVDVTVLLSASVNVPSAG